MPTKPKTETLEHLPVDALVPYARNTRTHSAEQIAQLAAAIREFGFTNPVLIDGEGGIIAGHGRIMAAQQLGMDTVPCRRLTHLSDAQKRAYIIADNKLALNAGWDEDLLAEELAALAALDIDLGLTGFDTSEIDALLGACSAASAPPAAHGDGAGFNYQEKFAVLVECSGESHQADVFNKLTGIGLACKVLVN
jgi:ParB-like chromosome segregation protein Spo0J